MIVDRTRQFNLPQIQDLNKDQDEAMALPLEGQHLIIGGPGTGKSVVALLRARRLAQSDKPYRVLVYNRLLEQSNRHLFGSEYAFRAKTWISWFHSIFGCFFNRNTPRLPPEASGYRPIDWVAVEQQLQALDNFEEQSNTFEFLIIDEGQDMPLAFYQTLTQLGFENFYVAADQNQQINPDECSARQDIENALALASDQTLELKTNYRNTRPIALLAQHFYPADPASPKPDLPDQAPTAVIPELWTYGMQSTPALSTIADSILQLSDRNPRKLIGVITPGNKVRVKFYDTLLGCNPTLDNDKPPIQTYVSSQSEQLDFSHGGIMVINVQSCKGLEFDIAILADIDQHQPKHELDALKAKFYVMVARARERVMLLRTGYTCPIVEKLLPSDPSILIRK